MSKMATGDSKKGKRASGRRSSFLVTKNESDLKWQRANGVIGALQVRTE